LGCESVTITQQLFALDSQALAESKLVSQAARTIIKNPSASSKAKAIARKAIVDAKALYTKAWSDIWKTSQVFNNCTNSQFCVQIDNTSTVSGFLQNSADFLTILNKLNKELKKIGLSHRVKSNLRTYRILRNKDVEEANKVPVSSSSCSSSDKVS